MAFNSRSRYFKFCWPRIQSYGLRFLKQNIPEIEILEYPTWEQYVKKLREGWDVVGFSCYLSDTPEVLEMVEYARSAGIEEIWCGNYGALTPEIQDRFDKIFIGYAEHEVAAEVGREIDFIVHPPLFEYLATPFGAKLNWYGIMFTTRGCPAGCRFCQTSAFCNKPSVIPIESIERLLSYYRDLGVKIVLIEDENFGVLQKHADEVVQLLEKYEMLWGCMVRADFLQKKADEWIVSYEENQRNGKFTGFGGAAVGIESFHQSTLDGVKKKETAADIMGVLQKLKEHGLATVGYYMIGFENETVESIRADIEKLASLRLDLTQVCVVTPLPLTPLWDDIDEKYGIFEKDYHKFDGKHLVWNHPNISPTEMEQLIDWAVRKAYPRRMAIISSYRIWSDALKRGGIPGLTKVFKLMYQANRFDFLPDKPRFFEIKT
ncbi:MAG: radical SAM protein [Euryarchaeota archaeon]|nr:radical SAM protein [Euryarchaeota archaeon]